MLEKTHDEKNYLVFASCKSSCKIGGEVRAARNHLAYFWAYIPKAYTVAKPNQWDGNGAP
jgi:hypothetical protein